MMEDSCVSSVNECRGASLAENNLIKEREGERERERERDLLVSLLVLAVY